MYCPARTRDEDDTRPDQGPFKTVCLEPSGKPVLSFIAPPPFPIIPSQGSSHSWTSAWNVRQRGEGSQGSLSVSPAGPFAGIERRVTTRRHATQSKLANLPFVQLA